MEYIYEILMIIDILAFLYLLSQTRVEHSRAKKFFTRFVFLFIFLLMFDIAQRYIVTSAKGTNFTLEGFLISTMVAFPFSIIDGFVEEKKLGRVNNLMNGEKNTIDEAKRKKKEILPIILLRMKAAYFLVVDKFSNSLKLSPDKRVTTGVEVNLPHKLTPGACVGDFQICKIISGSVCLMYSRESKKEDKILEYGLSVERFFVSNLS